MSPRARSSRPDARWDDADYLFDFAPGYLGGQRLETEAPVASAYAPFRTPRRPMKAAGLLLTHVDETGERWWLLAQRSRAVRSGGCWANFGGEVDPGETELAAAFREMYEETGLPAARLQGATIAQVVESRDGAVNYTLFVLEVPDWIENLELTWENDDAAWCNEAEVDALPLHPGFAATWKVLPR